MAPTDLVCDYNVVAVGVNVIPPGRGVIYTLEGAVDLISLYNKEISSFCEKWLFNSEDSFWNHLEIDLYGLLNDIQNS